MQNSHRELTARDVAFSITKEEVETLSGKNGTPDIIGQPRAIQALKMGIEIRAKGYNVFVSGLSGTGKRTAITRLLEEYRPEKLSLTDIALVYNFRSPYNPKALYFTAGSGNKFKKDIAELIETVRTRIEKKMLHAQLEAEKEANEDAEGSDRERRSGEPETGRWQAAASEERVFVEDVTDVLEEIHRRIEALSGAYPDEKVRAHLGELEEDLRQNLYVFTQEDTARDETGATVAVRYGVNLLVDHSETVKCPVVFEKRPTYANLFGTVEAVFEPGGESRTNFMMIRPGSLIQASGGFLVLQAEDIIDEEEAWSALKWAIRDCKVEIQTQSGPLSPPAPHLKPEPIEIDVKLIMMGNDQMYDILYTLDEDFKKLFKIPAEFDSVMKRDERSTSQYIAFMRKIVEEERLRPMEYSGIAAVIEYGIRLSERRNRLSTRFSMIADIIREADYWAGKLGEQEISRTAVETAIKKRTYLFNLPEEKIDEEILSGELLIPVTGKEIGKVNALAVLDRGYYAFGRPALITARVSPGSGGIINIERESGLSGEIHDKGILIIDGFLRAKYSKNIPLSITASICFEQSYIEVDGDSASSAEAYVLLSAIAEVPLRLDLAVTGSFNQMGEIQPVGGITEKVEGFFEICKKLGLTGEQGVIIPEKNIESLTLSREVQEAIEQGRFHLYPVRTIDEGMEILTGMKAGELNGRGVFPLNTINHMVEKRLREIAGQVKVYGGS
jgi:lon-related putative ATP-dependent protease